MHISVEPRHDTCPNPPVPLMPRVGFRGAEEGILGAGDMSGFDMSVYGPYWSHWLDRFFGGLAIFVATEKPFHNSTRNGKAFIERIIPAEVQI